MKSGNGPRNHEGLLRESAVRHFLIDDSPVVTNLRGLEQTTHIHQLLSFLRDIGDNLWEFLKINSAVITQKVHIYELVNPVTNAFIMLGSVVQVHP